MKTALLECAAAASDAVLTAARLAVSANRHGLPDYSDVPSRNRDLVALLDCLLDAALAVSKAIDDNAWDHAAPVPDSRAADARGTAYQIASAISNAAHAPRGLA
jgi:hypothetical protein